VYGREAVFEGCRGQPPGIMPWSIIVPVEPHGVARHISRTGKSVISGSPPFGCTAGTFHRTWMHTPAFSVLDCLKFIPEVLTLEHPASLPCAILSLSMSPTKHFIYFFKENDTPTDTLRGKMFYILPYSNLFMFVFEAPVSQTQAHQHSWFAEGMGPSPPRPNYVF